MRLKNWGQQSPTILDCDVIFFPVHLGMHWALVMALVNEKRIVYYDSLQVVVEYYQWTFVIPNAIHALGLIVLYAGVNSFPCVAG